MTRNGLIVPRGSDAMLDSGPGGLGGAWPKEAHGTGAVVNQTDLPDRTVMGALKDYYVESASMAWGHETNFQMYSNPQQGSLLARSEYRTPTNVIEEIRLARNLAERDDDVRAVMGAMIALAFSEGMEHVHQDEQTAAVFNEIARLSNLDHVLKTMYREYLIASQFTSAMLFTREEIDYTPEGSDEEITEMVSSPVIGVFESEHIRVIGNDMFGTATLAYDPPDERQRRWLDEYFNPRTTAPRKAEMGRNDRAMANLFVGVHQVNPYDPVEDQPNNFGSDKLYLLNPRLCHRTSMPKGPKKYPTPLLTSNFALLEAKRLLNLMDYALLQGGSNFVVVAKKGSDERPAHPEEVENLKNVVRVASKSGVIVGDHRLNFEIITPELKELLNAEKRKLIGRKLAMAMLRTPERDEQTGSENEAGDLQITTHVITSDREDIRRHVEGDCYREITRRNRRLLKKGPPGIWFPKIVLQGLRYFTDLVLKLRDRGDIARSTAVAAAGFSWRAEVEKRKGELARGEDEVMIPGQVPHSSPEQGPQDNPQGRPPGAGDGQPSGDPAHPTRVVQQNPGETVRAWYEEEAGEVVRAGHITYAILEEHADTKSVGRVTQYEREAIENEEAVRRGSAAVVPVNVGVPVEEELRAIRLREGLSMVIGYRRWDGAIIAKALTFKEPQFPTRDAESAVARWGFPMALIEEGDQDGS